VIGGFLTRHNAVTGPRQLKSEHHLTTRGLVIEGNGSTNESADGVSSVPERNAEQSIHTVPKEWMTL